MISNLVVLISGSGSNLQALIDAIASEELPNATIAKVISNKKSAFGLERASRSGLATAYHNLVPYGKRFPSSDPSTKYSPAAREVRTIYGSFYPYLSRRVKASHGEFIRIFKHLLVIEHDIRWLILEHNADFNMFQAYDADLAEIVLSVKPDMVVCAGW